MLLDLFLSTLIFCAILSGIFKTLFFHYFLLTCEYDRFFYIDFVFYDFTKFIYWFLWLFCTFLGVSYMNYHIICKQAQFCFFSELCLFFLLSWLTAMSGTTSTMLNRSRKRHLCSQYWGDKSVFHC